jgi:predicted transcriptional regulator
MILEILSAVESGVDKTTRIMYKVGLSYGSAQRYLSSLVDQGLVERLKVPRKGPGRPLFDYRLSKGTKKAVSALLDPSMGLVVVSFEGLRRFCRREKGGFCKEIRSRCTPISCPQIVRWA